MKTVRHTTIFVEGSMGIGYDWVEMQKFSLEEKERDTILMQSLFKTNKESIGFGRVHTFIIQFELPYSINSQNKYFVNAMGKLIIDYPRFMDYKIQIGFPSLDDALLFTSNNLEEIKQLACNSSHVVT